MQRRFSAHGQAYNPGVLPHQLCMPFASEYVEKPSRTSRQPLTACRRDREATTDTLEPILRRRSIFKRVTLPTSQTQRPEAAPNRFPTGYRRRLPTIRWGSVDVDHVVHRLLHLLFWRHDPHMRRGPVVVETIAQKDRALREGQQHLFGQRTLVDATRRRRNTAILVDRFHFLSHWKSHGFSKFHPLEIRNSTSTVIAFRQAVNANFRQANNRIADLIHHENR